jgi:hypothetical protein
MIKPFKIGHDPSLATQGRPRSGGVPARGELRQDRRQIRCRGINQQHIDHDDNHNQATHHHEPTALRRLPRQVVDRRDAATTHHDRTGPTTVEGLAVYRFLFDDGPSHGEAAISGTVSNDELIFRLKPADTGPRGWYLGTIWSGRLDAATGGFAIDLPSPTTGELLTIEFLPATVDDYNQALRNAKP